MEASPLPIPDGDSHWLLECMPGASVLPGGNPRCSLSSVGRLKLNFSAKCLDYSFNESY